MRIDNQFTVQAPVERVWDYMLDVEKVAPCMPGGEQQRGVGRGWATCRRRLVGARRPGPWGRAGQGLPARALGVLAGRRPVLRATVRWLGHLAPKAQRARWSCPFDL